MFFEKIFITITSFSFLIFSPGCKHLPGANSFSSPEGYDLSNGEKIKLPLELDEISGIAYYHKDSSLLAINDEFGWLYKIFITHPKEIQKWKFSPGADFEDLVLFDSSFFVLKSSGNILVFKFTSSDSLLLSEHIFPFGSGNEFEVLYYDPGLKKLVLLCKDCESDKKKFLSSYLFDPEVARFEENKATIDVNHIAELLGEDKLKFKPSAAALHPVTHELYMVSAVNNLLVIADENGLAKEVHKIDPLKFKQPEGISFAPGGDMYISNESAEQGLANVLVFPYRQIKVSKK